MSFSTQIQLPEWNKLNSLFDNDAIRISHNQAAASDYLPQSLSLENQTSQQNLDDRSTLRGLAGDLANRTPNALATAATLPVGVPAVNALSTMDSQTAASKLNALQFNMGLPQMPYGPAGGAGSSIAPADGSGGADPGGMAPGFIDRLGGRESGNNSASVNRQGYSGKLQFGTGRMTDLGMYQPAQGENPNGNQWSGSITVPGFAPMTHQQFLQSPDAQRMAAEVHFKNIGEVIDNTPGAQDFNRTGLAAVAHLGGIQGMQDFIASGGKYNPHDHNGTSLQDYYTKFSSGGPALAQASFGHPDGPLPANHPARGVQVASASNTAGIPAIATDAVPITAGALPAPGSTVSDTPDQLQAKLAQMRAGGAATPVPAPPVPSASDQPSPAVQGIDQFLRSQILPQQGASPAPPPVAAPQQPAGGNARTNALFAPSAPAVAAPSNPQFPIADQGPSSQAVQQVPAGATALPQPPQTVQQAAAPYNPMAGLPPGAKPITTASGMPYTTGAPAGYAMAQTPPSAQFPRGQMVPYPLVPPVLKQEKTPDAILNIDPRTGQVVSRTPITETGRETFKDTPQGQQGFMNGHPVGAPIPFSGRPEQNEAYKADQKTAAGISASGLAAQGVMPRLNEMAQLGAGLQTGLGGEFRSKMQAVLEQLGADPVAAAKLTGISSAADADEYRKLAISTAGTAAKADLGANNGVEAMRIYQSANPGMNLQPDANKRITNMLRVQQQSQQDYAQAAAQHFGDNESKFLGGGSYAPLTSFNRQWQAQSNPQVYAAATGILNGDPYEKWKARLSSPDEGARAAAIVARIDPNAMVPVQGGMMPVRQLLAKMPAGGSK